ncbi:unnamed protein product [Sphagnum troendelagicum]
MASGNTKQVVLITGCAKGGIGHEYCYFFAERGYQVFASDVQPLESMSSLLEHGIHVLQIDITSEESVREGVEAVMKQAGRIDVLINNAGIGLMAPLAEVPMAQVRRIFEVNVFGGLSLVQAVVPHMVSAGGGRIINVSSMLGRIALPWIGPYCATKAAVFSLSDTLRVELKPFNIDVITVTPASVRSNIYKVFASSLQHNNKEWSLYKGFEAAMLKMAGTMGIPESTPAAVFAKKVVTVVTRKNPPIRYTGGHMTTSLTLLTWLPAWLLDIVKTRLYVFKRPVHNNNHGD